MRTLLFGLLVLPFLVGCGGRKVTVSGQVLFDGKPLPGGYVLFRPVDTKHNAVTAELDEQGNYQAILPAGEVQVAVDNRELQPRPTGPIARPPDMPAEVQKAMNENKSTPPSQSTTNPNAPPKLRGKYVPIPEKFYSGEDSGLTFTVDPSNPKHDIELK